MPASALTARAAGAKGGGGEDEQARLGVAITRLALHRRGGMGLEDGSKVGPIGIQAVPMGWGRPAALARFGAAHYGLATMITRATTNTTSSAAELAATRHASNCRPAASGESSVTRR